MLTGKLVLNFKAFFFFLPSGTSAQWAELIFVLVAVLYIKSEKWCSLGVVPCRAGSWTLEIKPVSPFQLMAVSVVYC